MLIFYCFIYITLFIDIIISKKVVVLKFKELTEEYNYSKKNINYSLWLLNNYLKYKIITEIKIGTPSKLIPFLINSNIKIFRIRIDNIIEDLDYNKYNYNYDYYIPSKSSSFKNITEIMNLEPIFSFYYSLINETIRLCTDKNCINEIEIENINFFLENFNDNNIKINENNSHLKEINYSYKYGELSFSTSIQTSNQPILFEELKSLGIINSLITTIVYTSDKEGLIYIGDYPHIINKNLYKEDEFMTAYTYQLQGCSSQLNLRLNRLYLINKNKEYIDLENNIISFNFGLGIILCTKEYYNKIINIFFSDYFDKNICVEDKINKGRNEYYILSCKKTKEFKIEEFPSLFFFKEEFKFFFELNYKDLFKEINNIYYFLVIYFPFSNNYFELGKPFIKKYKITYNPEINTINFYNNLLKKKNNNNKDIRNNIFNRFVIIFIIGIFIIILLLIIFIYIIKKVFHKRKLRTNELDDEYDYDYKSNTSINL